MCRLVRFFKGNLTPVWQLLNLLSKDLLILSYFFSWILPKMCKVPKMCKAKAESPCSRCF